MDSRRVVKSVATDIQKLCGSNRSSYRADKNFLLQKAGVGERMQTHTHKTFLNAATCSRIELKECIWKATQQPTPKWTDTDTGDNYSWYQSVQYFENSTPYWASVAVDLVFQHWCLISNFSWRPNSGVLFPCNCYGKSNPQFICSDCTDKT